jgi:membrane protein DedA with SNARE-associated domain
MIEWLTQTLTDIIRTIGYPGIGILMALESMVVPVPSEIVMPFVGYLVAQERFSFFTAAIVSTIGCLVGALLSYYMGYYGGETLVKKVGKYLLLDQEHLEWTKRWFNKHGEKTIFISRFVPVVRHVISIPAGIGKMNITKFSAYTFFGSLIWNSILMYVGLKLGENWGLVHKYSTKIDIALIIVILAGLLYYAWRIYKNYHKKEKVQ